TPATRPAPPFAGLSLEIHETLTRAPGGETRFRDAARLCRAAASVGGFGGRSEPPMYLGERHGFAGALPSAGGWGPCRGPHSKWGALGAPHLLKRQRSRGADETVRRRADRTARWWRSGPRRRPHAAGGRRARRW